MDNWGKGILNDKIVLVKNYILGTYEPSPQKSPDFGNGENTDHNFRLIFEVHEDDPYARQ